MEDFNIGAMKARNIAEQFGVIEKAEMSDEEVMKARQVGDMHPNGKWVWTEYRPGHFDWRPLKGHGDVDRTPKKGDDGGYDGGNGGGDDKKPKKPEMKQETSGEDKKKIAGVSDIMEGFRIQTNKYSDLSKMSLQKTPKGNWRLYYDGKDTGTTMQASVISDANAKKAGLWKEEEEKKAPTLDDHAKKTPTKTLENAAKSSKAPGSVKGAAEAELKERKNKEIAKKLNLHSKGELATELTRIASEWDSYDDAQKTQTKQAIAQAHSTVLKNITSGNASDEAIAALADLTSIQNFFKDTASQPKQVGDIVKDLVADLKAKNSNDTTAGKEKIEGIVNKVSTLPAGKSIKFSANGREIELKKEKTFDDGTSQFTLYEGGVGRYTSIDAEKTVKNLLDYYPEAKESKDTKSSSKSFAQARADLRNILNRLDTWDDDDWMDDEKNKKLTSSISDIVKKYDLSEEDFNKIAKEYQGLDLWYPDYAPREKVLPKITKEIHSELAKFDDFTDDDWNNPEKQNSIIKNISRKISLYNITKKEWNEIKKPYAEGLSGLPYEDFV